MIGHRGSIVPDHGNDAIDCNEQPFWREPLPENEWLTACLTNYPKLEDLSRVVMRHGVPSCRRPLVWLFLLSVVRYGLPYDEVRKRIDCLEETYAAWRKKLEEFKPSNPEEASHFEEQTDIIYHDVLRFDRDYLAHHNTNDNVDSVDESETEVIARLQEGMQRVLKVYVLVNRYPGYFQGMSDLLEPIYCVVRSEALAFHLFAEYMSFAGGRFEAGAADDTQVRYPGDSSLLILLRRSHPAGRER